MRSVSLLEALCHVVPWHIRRPVARDVVLFQDAEFRIMLHELRYPPFHSLSNTSAAIEGHAVRTSIAHSRV
jgi:hypothetical protein